VDTKRTVGTAQQTVQVFCSTAAPLVLRTAAACIQALPVAGLLLGARSWFKGAANEFSTAQAFPSSIVDWLVRGALAVLALGIARTCWLRRVKREEGQAQRVAEDLAKRTRQLTLEKQDAEDASRTKSQLLASVNREIQAPMNGVLNSLELALMTELTEEQRYYLERTKSHAREALAVLGTVLESYASGTGILKVSRDLFSLRDCIRRVLNKATPWAKERGIELQTEIAPDCPESLLGDPDLLHRVLENVLKTAISSSSTGKLSLVAHPDRRAEREGHIGNRTAFLFFSLEERGRRASNCQTDTATGLSDENTHTILAECRALLKLLNGSIWVYSAEGRGSKICLTAQFEMAPAKSHRLETPCEKKAPAARARVLLIDDHRVSQLTLVPVLEQQGLRCMTASRSSEAGDLLQQHPFDLVIVDFNTLSAEDPETSQLIREIKAQQAGSRASILALTGRLTRSERQEYLRAGATECISKPVEPGELHRVIRDMLSARAEAQEVI